jgi:hypothetical protein
MFSFLIIPYKQVLLCMESGSDYCRACAYKRRLVELTILLCEGRVNRSMKNYLERT